MFLPLGAFPAVCFPGAQAGVWEGDVDRVEVPVALSVSTILFSLPLTCVDLACSALSL